jgi:hypothetical protein
MSEPLFVEVYVEPCAAATDGREQRFRRVPGTAEREVRRVRYEAEDGTEGMWAVVAVDDEAAGAVRPARAYTVEDSSEGTVWLVVGGLHGLRLEHEDTGVTASEPYLLLGRAVPLE